MAYLLVFVILLHLTTLVMLFFSTTVKSWWVYDNVEKKYLGHNCKFENSTGSYFCASTADMKWFQAVQVLMVLSVVFSSVSFLVFLGQLFTTSKGGLDYFTGLCQVFAGLTTFSATFIYTLYIEEIIQNTQKKTSGHFSYRFFLAWLCVPLLLCSGLTYIHLHKKRGDKVEPYQQS